MVCCARVMLSVCSDAIGNTVLCFYFVRGAALVPVNKDGYYCCYTIFRVAVLEGGGILCKKERR